MGPSALTRLWHRVAEEAAARSAGLKADSGLRIQWLEPARIGPSWAKLVFVEDPATGTRCSGFGIDRRATRAALKALMESAESLALSSLGEEDRESRSGVAAHVSWERACAAAGAELVERDALLFHWLTEIPGRAIRERMDRDVSPELAEEHRPRAVELRSADPLIHVALVGSRARSTGCWYLGLGTGRDLDLATRSGAREWLGAVFRHRFVGGCPRPAEAADSRRRIHEEHHAASQDPPVSALLERILDGASGPWEAPRSIPRIRTRSIPCPVMPGVQVALAESENLARLRFGAAYAPACIEAQAIPRFARALPAQPRFHPRNGFLPHPF